MAAIGGVVVSTVTTTIARTRRIRLIMLLSRPFSLEQNRLPLIVAEFATSSVRPTMHPSLKDEVLSLYPTLSSYLYSLYCLEGVFSETHIHDLA